MPDTVGFKVIARENKSLERKLQRDITKLTEKQFRQQATQLFSAVNKRISRIEESGVISPAVDALKDTGGAHFSVRGKSGEALIKEYNRALNFYNLQTSTLKGARAFTNELSQYVDTSNKDTIADIFDLVHSAQERMPNVKGKGGTNEIIQAINEMYLDNVSQINKNKILREDALMNIVNRIVNSVGKIYTVEVTPIEGGRLF